MRDTIDFPSGDEEYIDKESFLEEDDENTAPVISASFCDIRSRSRNNINDVTVPFIKGNFMRNEIRDWREELKKVKTQIGKIEDNKYLSEKHEIDKGDTKQFETETSVNYLKTKGLPSDNNKITIRREGILQQLQVPLKKITTYGNNDTPLIKAYADVSEFPNNCSFSPQSDYKGVSSKLRFREITIVRNASGPDDLENASVCTYGEFIKNIPVIQYLLKSDYLGDIEDVDDSYESFVDGLLQRPRFTLYSVNGSLEVSSNLVS